MEYLSAKNNYDNEKLNDNPILYETCNTNTPTIIFLQ